VDCIELSAAYNIDVTSFVTPVLLFVTQSGL